MFAQLRPAVVLFSLLTVLTGVVYPLAVTGVARAVFPDKASGSLIESDGKAVGSTLIGQQFDDPRYFWSRPSATGPVPYNAAASSGSNYGPLSPALKDVVNARIDALRKADPSGLPNNVQIPVDLVTASGSGLDPHISPAAAEFQVRRIAAVRAISEDSVRRLVAGHTQGRQWGVLGEPRVNVLTLNRALDAADLAVHTNNP